MARVWTARWTAPGVRPGRPAFAPAPALCGPHATAAAMTAVAVRVWAMRVVRWFRRMRRPLILWCPPRQFPGANGCKSARPHRARCEQAPSARPPTPRALAATVRREGRVPASNTASTGGTAHGARVRVRAAHRAGLRAGRPRRLGPRREAGRARRVPLHPRRLPVDVHRPPVDHAPVRRLRHRHGVQRPLQAAHRPRHHGPVGRLRPADPDGPRLRRADRLAARSARWASPSTRSTTCASCSTASRSTRCRRP